MTWILKLNSPSEPTRVRYYGKHTLPVSDALEAMTFDSEAHAVQAVSDLSGSGFSHLLEPMEVPAGSGIAFLMSAQASASAPVVASTPSSPRAAGTPSK